MTISGRKPILVRTGVLRNPRRQYSQQFAGVKAGGYGNIVAWVLWHPPRKYSARVTTRGVIAPWGVSARFYPWAGATVLLPPLICGRVISRGCYQNFPSRGGAIVYETIIEKREVDVGHHPTCWDACYPSMIELFSRKKPLAPVSRLGFSVSARTGCVVCTH